MNTTTILTQGVIKQWRTDYNEYRPHSMLGYKTPAEVAKQLRSWCITADWTKKDVVAILGAGQNHGRYQSVIAREDIEFF